MLVGDCVHGLHMYLRVLRGRGRLRVPRLPIPAGAGRFVKEQHRASRCGLAYQCPDGACGPHGC
jgi:hypothetical protein